MTLLEADILRAAERLACVEFEAFQLEYEVEPVPRRQELRAGCIVWLAAILPEAFDGGWIREIDRWLHGLKVEHRDSTHWFRVPALRAAIAVWNEDSDALVEVIANVDHHNSGLRGYILECLAFAAPTLSFEDEELRSRVESVLRQHYLYGDAAVTVLLSTKGLRSAKADWASGWVDLVQESFGRQQLEAAIHGRVVANPLYEGMCEIERYSLLALLEEVAAVEKLSEDHRPGAEEVFVQVVRGRLADHPLMNPTFRIPE